jgi:hypothetical protein
MSINWEDSFQNNEIIICEYIEPVSAQKKQEDKNVLKNKSKYSMDALLYGA